MTKSYLWWMAVIFVLCFDFSVAGQTTVRTSMQDHSNRNLSGSTSSPRQRIDFRIDRVVAQELGLLDSQREELRELQAVFYSKIRAEVQVPEGLSEEEQIEFVENERTQLFDEFSARLNEILLPAQRERLDQILLQKQVGTDVNARSVLHPRVIEALGLSRDDASRIQRRADEIATKLEADIAKLKERAKQEFLNELSEEQQTKVKQMLGGKFETRYERRMREIEDDESNR